ncbi:diguanylate cyclase [Marinomonas mediterranea]|uniref:GGDEF domain-containing protein n=1 Tax=Marinomonas mediterranea TaxID=119864 RepID=UPI00234B606A|nr:GGDEF domain-containing protein [Marinomonas mediterranea]WCN11701.1 diguanylate cyclase [Marinomonas mediterranea]
MDEKTIPLGFENAFKRMVVAALGGSAFFLVLYSVFPPEFESHWMGALYAFSNLAILGLFLQFAPQSKLKWIIIGLQFSFVTTFIPISWYFVIEAWREHWTLVESFPPILPFIVVSSAMVILLMNVNRLPYYIVGSWFLIAIPVVTYLFFHPVELTSPRGLEFLFAFGPASVFFVLVVPYQMTFANKYHRMLTLLQRARDEADRDYVTDLRNQRGLEEWAKHVSIKTRSMVLLARIDNFSHLKKEYGHDASDRLLVEFSSRLRIVYQGGHVLAKYRENEFLIVLVNPDIDETENVADDFHSWLSATGYKDIGDESVAVNIGVSSIGTFEQFDDLVDQANQALDNIKEQGGAPVQFYVESVSTRVQSATT